jgi:hypothetical protein
MATAASASVPAARRKRRWFQFSLRTLLVFVVLIGCGLGWLGVKVQKGRRQKAVVDAIVKSGAGLVTYDYEFDSQGRRVPNPAPPGPKWLQSLLGVDFFQRVDSVIYYGDYPVVAADLECIKDLPQLRALHVLGRQRMPVAAFKPLAVLTELETLHLNDPELTDAEMEYFKALTHLTMLDLRSSRITDAGLESLRGLTRLEVLDLRGAQVTDDGLERIKGLTQLTDLDLTGTLVTDAGLKYLENFTQLKDLQLGETHVTGAGLSHLKGLSQLSSLELDSNDDAIPFLAGLTQLKDLRVGGISDAGLAKLQQALPDCGINLPLVVSMNEPAPGIKFAGEAPAPQHERQVGSVLKS